MSQSTFSFPVGYHPFHKDRHMNFQINRWYSLGYWTKEEAQRAGAGVQGLSDWKREMVALAEQLTAEERELAAAFGYRAAEFLTHPHDADKIPLYDQFCDRFYAAVQDGQMERCSVPYQDTSLPALRFSPEQSRGTIVIHGGLDSFMEEFYSIACYLVDAGYEVILFEGPGQGAALRRGNLTMTHEWEKPVAAVLDHFEFVDVTLVGVSLGGYLAPRAAAFEERITRLVAFDVFIYDQHGSGLQGAAYKLFLRYPAFYNWVARAAMRRSVNADHVINQWLYITGTRTPAEWIALVQDYSVSDIASRVRQDVLLLAGAEDHMIPLQEYHKNMKGLTNARSLTGRIFTAEEQAQNHCQVGNLKLALDVILHWIDEKSSAA
ncbi:MAG: alpha/beta fold hydrolase [Anaerolineae bacterium]